MVNCFAWLEHLAGILFTRKTSSPPKNTSNSSGYPSFLFVKSAPLATSSPLSGAVTTADLSCTGQETWRAESFLQVIGIYQCHIHFGRHWVSCSHEVSKTGHKTRWHIFNTSRWLQHQPNHAVVTQPLNISFWRYFVELFCFSCLQQVKHDPRTLQSRYRPYVYINGKHPSCSMLRLYQLNPLCMSLEMLWDFYGKYHFS